MYISKLLIISLLSYCVSTFGHPNNYCSGYCNANFEIIYQQVLLSTHSL